MSTSIHKNVWLFLPIAFGFAWLFWIPVALTGVDYQTSPRLLAVTLVGVFDPGWKGTFPSNIIDLDHHHSWSDTLAPGNQLTSADSDTPGRIIGFRSDLGNPGGALPGACNLLHSG